MGGRIKNRHLTGYIYKIDCILDSTPIYNSSKPIMSENGAAIGKRKADSSLDNGGGGSATKKD